MADTTTEAAAPHSTFDVSQLNIYLVWVSRVLMLRYPHVDGLGTGLRQSDQSSHSSTPEISQCIC